MHASYGKTTNPWEPSSDGPGVLQPLFKWSVTETGPLNPPYGASSKILHGRTQTGFCEPAQTLLAIHLSPSAESSLWLSVLPCPHGTCNLTTIVVPWFPSPGIGSKREGGGEVDPKCQLYASLPKRYPSSVSNMRSVRNGKCGQT